ncbi:hypothetical protein [Paenibacillus hamazuiensis]|uniref:hypothetical protein n=1 Tax=Paenibacillus hamazuiensis TaxID=2936508 RepID=UPI00200E075D|nr:hypothetical protein [Paenibacillus hamazuiensis]
MFLRKLKSLFHKQTQKRQPEPYKMMEIEATIKHAASGLGTYYTLVLEVIDQGSFFTKDIFIRNVEDKTKLELFYNYSALGMNLDDLHRYGSTHKAEYHFDSLEEARKAKETTIGYVRFLIREHQQVHQSAKIS